MCVSDVYDGVRKAVSQGNPMQMTDRPDKTRKPLTPEAERALTEANARRAEIDAKAAAAPKEKAGRGGLDPVRYDDWEIKGIASDF